MIKIPHLDLPFRFAVSQGSPYMSLATVEQDSLEDITNCVEVVIRYPLGFRSDVPDFGIPDLVFDQQPVTLDDTIAAVQEWEPRAHTGWRQSLDQDDVFTARILTVVSGRVS